MFEAPMRLLLLAGSLITIIFMLARIRSSQIAIKDSIFWIVFAMLLLVVSLFPELAVMASHLLKIQSPINFIYLLIIFVLLIKIFTSSLRISMLDTRLQQLAQRIALNEKDAEDNKQESTENR